MPQKGIPPFRPTLIHPFPHCATSANYCRVSFFCCLPRHTVTHPLLFTLQGFRALGHPREAVWEQACCPGPPHPSAWEGPLQGKGGSWHALLPPDPGSREGSAGKGSTEPPSRLQRPLPPGLAWGLIHPPGMASPKPRLGREGTQANLYVLVPIPDPQWNPGP